MTSASRLPVRLAGGLLLLWLALCLPLSGQSFTATVLGHVRDASGAAIAHAHVTLIGETDGSHRTTRTNRLGDYVFPGVPVGHYTLEVAHAGFTTFSAQHLTTTVAQSFRMNVLLRVGSQEQTVHVTASTPLIQTDSSTIGTVVSRRMILALPLNGRDYTQLATLAPDVMSPGSNGWASGALSIGGNRQSKTQFLVDGQANTETWSGGSLVSPSVDAIQEFNVQTSVAPAEYGQGAGFVNATTRSGSNQYHGSLYEFHRNSGLDARNFFAQSRAPLNRNQFGFAVGGPILRNRWFFYTDYERTNTHQDVTTNTLVPSAQMLTGDFSADPTPIIDPQTGKPFPGNRIPSSRLSSIAQYFQQFVPAPNSPGNHLILNVPQPVTNNLFTLRLDHQTALTHITGRYVYGSNNRVNAFGGQVYGASNPLGNTIENVATHNVSMDITRTLSPSLLLDLRGGYYYNHLYEYTPADSGVNRTVDSGIGGFKATTTSLQHGGFPTIGITSYGGIPGGTFLDILPKEGVQSYAASLTWIKGSHNIKAGVQLVRQLGTSHNYAYAKGYFQFTGLYTGDPYADYLLGLPNYSYRSFPQALWGARGHNLAFFAEDQWQVSPRLTLNYGLRLELNPYPSPINAGSNFEPGIGKIVLASQNGKVDFNAQPVAPYAYAQNPGWYETSQQAGVPYSLVQTAGGLWNPRFGFAWRPFGGTSTVVRGGSGIFTMPLLGQIDRGASVVNPPWQMTEFQYASTPRDWSTFWPEINLNNPNFITPLVTAVDTKFYNPYTIEWNFTIEHRLARDTALTVSYVGSKSTHLESNANFNQPHYGPNAWSQIPFPQFGSFGQYFHSNANSNHNALEVVLKKRFSNGLSLLSSYSWSKTIDYTSGDQAFVSDQYNMAVDRGLSSIDTGHRLVTSFLYQLPFGPGRHWLRDTGWTGKILGGWNTAGIMTLQSGLPFTVFNHTDNSGYFVASGQRANRNCGGELNNPTPNQWFDTSCFATATPYTVGTAGRNILRADGIANFDLSLIKNVRFSEARFLQLRAEAFNAMNTPTFAAPYSYIGFPTTGQVTSAGPPRVLQLGIKYYF